MTNEEFIKLVCKAWPCYRAVAMADDHAYMCHALDDECPHKNEEAKEYIKIHILNDNYITLAAYLSVEHKISNKNIDTATFCFWKLMVDAYELHKATLFRDQIIAIMEARYPELFGEDT